MIHVCLFGNPGVGKTTIKNLLQPQLPLMTIHEIENLRTTPDYARDILSKLQTYITVFIITLEGGRIQSDDMDLLQMFHSRYDCFILVNKATVFIDELTRNRIQSFFHRPVKICAIPDNVYLRDIAIQECCNIIGMLSPQKHEHFLWPFEELAQLKQKSVEEKKKQDDELKKVELEKQRLVKEKQAIDAQLALANKQLRDQENAKRAAIEAHYQRMAERQRQNQIQEQQRRQAAFEAQRQQEAQRQRLRDEQFRNQIARCGK
jgi:hypothetical protein